FFALGALLGLEDHFVQRTPFLFGIEVGQATWVVVGNQLFADPAILLSGYIAGGKMHKPGMVGAAKEFTKFDGRVGIRGKSIAKIGIEIGEPRAIDDQV